MTLVGLIGVALAGLSVWLVARAVALPRIRGGERVSEIFAYGAPPPEAAEEEPERRLAAALDRLAVRLGDALGPSVSGGEEAEIRRMLVAAGMYSTGPGLFLGYRALSVFGMVIAWLWLVPFIGSSTVLFLLGLCVAGLLGWRLPEMIVRDRATRRLAEVDYELPELIDSLVVTVEAGMGFSGALQLAAGEIEGPLGDELKLALREQNMGLSAEGALENMLDRADTPAMRSFVRSVLQGETLGVSIGEILRSLAAEMRSRRRASAEERAHKAPVKLLFPLVLLVFPAVFIVLLYPALYNITHNLGI